MFAVVAAGGYLARKMNQSVIPFYIILGILMGKNVLGRTSFLGQYEVYIAETTFMEIGAEIGIILLLFFLGLEFNLDRLIEAKEKIGKAGTLDLVVNFGAGFLLGFSSFLLILSTGIREALLGGFLVAGIVYMSSSAIITKSLIDIGWIANDEAEPMLGTLIYEDVFIAIYLAVVSALLLRGEGFGAVLSSIGIAVGFILLLLILVYFGTRYFERMVETNSKEFKVLRIMGTTVLIGGAGLALGVSEGVSAFFVGMAFSGTDHADDVEEIMEPVRDVFAAVFFFWIGLITDPRLFLGAAPMIILAVVVTTPTKLFTGYYGGKIYGLSEKRCVRTALGMTARGEFSLIIATLALAGAGIMGGTAENIYAFSVGYVLLMSILGTMLMEHSGFFEKRFAG